MSEVRYASGPIECKECGKSFETIEQNHLQSQNCTGDVDDVEEYRSKYPEAPTRSTEMRDKIVSGLKSDEDQ